MAELRRNGLLGWWSDAVCRRPKWVLAVAVASAAACTAYTALNLRFQSDRNALLSMELDWNRRFEDWRHSFPGHDDFYVVVDSGVSPSDSAQRAQQVSRTQAMVEDLGAALLADRHVESAVWSFDRSQFMPKAVRMLPIPQFERRMRQIAQSRLLLAGRSPQQLLAGVVGMMQKQPREDVDESQVAQSIQQFTGMVRAMGRVIETDDSGRPSLGEMIENDSEPSRVYLTSENGRLYFIRLTPRKDQDTVNALAGPIDAIRAVIKEACAKHEGIEAGLTSIDVVEADETEAVMWDSTVSSIVASVLILGVLVTAFHSVRVPALAMAALLVGVAWSFGFLTLAVGHLQVLSVVFVVMLLGLGIAYGIYLASGVELVRHRFGDDAEGFAAAMRSSFKTTGPGVFTGAVTTAAAFGTTIFTDFRGVSEMGQIAGAGIMLCWLAMFTVFPALLRLFTPGKAT